jgi:hypothetical protein
MTRREQEKLDQMDADIRAIIDQATKNGEDAEAAVHAALRDRGWLASRKAQLNLPMEHNDDIVEQTVKEMVQMEPNLKGREVEVRGVVVRALMAYLKEKGVPQGTPIGGPR